MKTIQTTWTGIRPLVMSNPQTVEMSNRYALTSRRLNNEMKDARKKSNEDKMMEVEASIKRNDWEASAYFDDEAGCFFLPDTVILAAIRSGAMIDKRGKDIETAVMVSETSVALKTAARHASLDEYFADPAFRLSCPAKVPPKTGALIWKTRCMIPTGWELTFNIEFEETIVARTTIERAMVNAGALKGIGGWRPKFGRFTVETSEA